MMIGKQAAGFEQPEWQRINGYCSKKGMTTR